MLSEGAFSATESIGSRGQCPLHVNVLPTDISLFYFSSANDARSLADNPNLVSADEGVFDVFLDLETL